MLLAASWRAPDWEENGAHLSGSSLGFDAWVDVDSLVWVGVPQSYIDAGGSGDGRMRHEAGRGMMYIGINSWWPLVVGWLVGDGELGALYMTAGPAMIVL